MWFRWLFFIKYNVFKCPSYPVWSILNFLPTHTHTHTHRHDSIALPLLCMVITCTLVHWHLGTLAAAHCTSANNEMGWVGWVWQTNGKSAQCMFWYGVCCCYWWSAVKCLLILVVSVPLEDRHHTQLRGLCWVAGNSGCNGWYIVYRSWDYITPARVPAWLHKSHTVSVGPHKFLLVSSLCQSPVVSCSLPCHL